MASHKEGFAKTYIRYTLQHFEIFHQTVVHLHFSTKRQNDSLHFTLSAAGEGLLQYRPLDRGRTADRDGADR